MSALHDYARTMRQLPTAAEQPPWRALRMKQVGGRKWRRQVPIGPYIVDFFCPQLRLVVEIDGETHVDSLTGDTLTAWLAARGSIVLRCWNNNVLSNLSGVLVLIAAHPSPNPLPEGEGVRNRQT